MAANTRKQSIYFDVLDFVPQQTHRKLQGDNENLSDTEDSVASKPFRARSGTDISDMLSSAKHRRSLRLQRSGAARMEALVPAEQILNLKEPMTRCPSLDLGGEVGLEVWLENRGDVVKDLLDLNEENADVEIEPNVRTCVMGMLLIMDGLFTNICA
jgi:hypothetical protein